MNDSDVKTGMRVVVTKDHGTIGMLIMDRHLSVRRIGAIGTVRNWVPGHGGDVWFVEHEAPDTDPRYPEQPAIGAYLYLEMEPFSPEAVEDARQRAREIEIAERTLKALKRGEPVPELTKA